MSPFDITAQPRASQLDFLLALFRPLLTMDEVSLLTDGLGRDHIAHLIDEGKFRAINIASSTESQRSLRIYRYSVEHQLLWPKRPLTMVPPETILSHSRAHFLKWEVANLLSCTTRHVENLGNGGALPGPSLSLGSLNRNPRYTREGVIEFLTSREVKS